MEKKVFKPSIKQLDNIAHSLGIALYDALLNPKKEYKTLPVEFYRNYFQVDKNDSWDELCNEGFAGFSSNSAHGLMFYYVTEKGIIYFREFFMKIIAYRNPKDRDLEYLKARINLYCDWCHYKFVSTDDNSEHIFSAYFNYWIKKYRVSHTTEDVLKRFLPDLKWYHKRGLIKSNW